MIYLTWMKTLAETYDAYAEYAGVWKDGYMLLPISHSTFNAQIEITIDENANLIDAKEVDEGDKVTVIPVTEDSATKTSGNTPHPLCDKLCYIAGDYSKYTGESKEEYYEAYMKQLEAWVKSEYSHPTLKLIYQYLEKGRLIQDLVERQVLKLGVNGKLTDEVKLQKLGQTGANVRFVVYINSAGAETRVWKNQDLYKRYIQFYQSLMKQEDLCYVSGYKEPCTDKHPYKIRNSGDKAKLLSGNDGSGFTYRGRFVTKKQAVSVGYQTSQKAHNALRWLLQKQGDTRDDCAMVCWMVNRDFALPDISKDSVHAYEKVDEIDLGTIIKNVQLERNKLDTGVNFAKKFRNAIQGYTGKLRIDDRVAVISLDAATTGRLSITYYDEMGARQYIDAILKWQEHCKWERFVPVGKDEERKWIFLESSPSPREMALAAFGVQRIGNDKKGHLDANKKLIKNTKERILPCITKIGVKIPKDIIKAAVNRASQPQTMDDFIWENQVLSVACAMIRYNYEEGEERMSTFLEDNRSNRNVLFGRLLAICDYMESRAMFERGEDGKPKEQRMTNAKRYWNAFSRRPAKTYKIIRENLNAYEKKLSSYEQKYFHDCLDEITDLLADSGFDNVALTELYLPGYSKQMKLMKEHFNNSKQNNEEK